MSKWACRHRLADGSHHDPLPRPPRAFRPRRRCPYRNDRGGILALPRDRIGDCCVLDRDVTLGPKNPRLHDRPYLDWLKTKPCVACHAAPPCDPAHIRIGLFAMGMKPDDRLATPLCRPCHDAQHAFGDESKWWKLAGLDPFEIAARLYAEFGGLGGKQKPPRKIKPRKPKAERQKIQSRGFR